MYVAELGDEGVKVWFFTVSHHAMELNVAIGCPFCTEFWRKFAGHVCAWRAGRILPNLYLRRQQVLRT